MLNHAQDLIRGSWRYATGLRGFLAATLSLDEAKSIIATQLQARDENFLRIMERGIYANPHSPYRRLLLNAGFQFDDVRHLVRERGLEGALSNLHERGVYVTLDEFKGRAPVRRHGLEFPVSAFDFDNPLLRPSLSGRSGGSRGSGTRVEIDFEQMAQEAAGLLVFNHANQLQKHASVMLRPAPPSNASLWSLLIQARAGFMPVRWFSPGTQSWNRQGLQGRLLTNYTLLVGRLVGRPVPRPLYDATARDVVRYIAGAVRSGGPVQIDAPASEWVRICLAAEELGEDIRGTVFRGAGEPYTEGKAAVLSRVGARGIPTYAMHEAGNIARGCGNPVAPDDMHLTADGIVTLPRPVRVEPDSEVAALFHTSLRTTAPKIMLNVESGDYAVLEARDCGCLLGELGFATHIHHVRSYEKLTSGGVMFMGSMLHRLLEETLPSRFGGSPLDYQLVEEERDGVPRVSVLASPEVGAIDEQMLIDTVIEELSFADWSRRQAEQWRRNGTLRVERRKPYLTRGGKILPLHVLDHGLAGSS